MVSKTAVLLITSNLRATDGRFWIAKEELYKALRLEAWGELAQEGEVERQVDEYCRILRWAGIIRNRETGPRVDDVEYQWI